LNAWRAVLDGAVRRALRGGSASDLGALSALKHEQPISDPVAQECCFELVGSLGVVGPALEMQRDHRPGSEDLGRAFLPSANRVLSTTKAAEELGGNVVGMEPWSEVELETPRGGTVKVTAVHAQHGPDGSDEIQGPVLGFVLSAPGADRIYVSGDNASRDVVRAIVQRAGELPIAILNAGAVQLPKFDRAYLTLSADHAADVAVSGSGRSETSPGSGP
jgi:Beta-lactamase superfamily domain